MKYEYSDTEFIKLNRKILEWEWFSDTCTRDVFIYCLLKANWKSGSWHGIEYDRGEFITSLPSISNDLGFSIKNVRTALNHLKRTGEVADRTSNNFRKISIKNYDKYQSNGRQNGSQGAAVIRTKEDKNIKEDKESDQLLPPWAAEKGWTPEYYERWRNQ